MRKFGLVAVVWMVGGLAALTLVACGGSGGSGSSGPSASLVNGTYCMAAFQGEPVGPTAQAIWGELVADGAGTFTSGSFFENDAGTLAGPMPIGGLTYTVGAGNVLQWLSGGSPATQGGISASGDIQALGSLGGDPSLFLLLRKAGVYGLATLTGTYKACMFTHDGGSFRAIYGTTTFDGAGAANHSYGFNTSGVITAGPLVSANAYTVAANGDATLGYAGLQLAGAILAGGNVAFFAGNTAGGNSQDLLVLIKEGVGMSNASLSGTYHLVGIESDAGMASSWRVLISTVSIDGAGMLTLGAGLENVDGTPGATAAEPPIAYSVGANGQLDIMGLTGGVAQDGNTAAVSGSTVGGEDPALFVLIK